jgi:hypothetical protein
MAQSNSDIAAKATTLVENHTFLSTVLAALCLLFAVNYYLTGPGSDGGSGLGGTGKYGESGLGGTGKTPDNGSGFKLGAADNNADEKNNDNNQQNGITDQFLVPEHLGSFPLTSEQLLADNLPATEQNTFDVHALRLAPLAFSKQDLTGDVSEVSAMIAAITLDKTPDSPNRNELESLLTENNALSSDILVSSMDILSSLMLAETENSLRLAIAEGVDSMQIADANIKSMIRTKLVVPARPERPDRFSIPVRITPVQRVGLPSPPPVRPMRTFSTLLNK